MTSVTVRGAGLAGCAAALTALRAGCPVELREKLAYPRHKVCGEFLSPETAPLLEALGVWNAFMRERPAPMRSLFVRLGKVEKRTRLPETAWGLSRYALDHLLQREAIFAGASDMRTADPPSSGIVIDATGRPAARLASGQRLFGFKAHFHGPVEDAVELYFAPGGYVGVSPVENGITNVCGLFSERTMRAHNFDMDELTNKHRPLAERLSALRRAWKWMSIGPLVMRNAFRDAAVPCTYLAGDALQFVEPFTGSGMLAALLTGKLAGEAAASGKAPGEYTQECRQRLERPFQLALLFRKWITAGLADYLAPIMPAGLLFRLTRPAL